MRIGIDARGINLYKGTGIGTYTQNLLKCLLQIDKENHYSIFWSGENYNSYKYENTRIILSSKKHHKFFEGSYFPISLRDDSIDLYHIPQNGIGMSSEINCKRVCTIHDLIPYIMPETVGKGYLRNFLRLMPEIIELSDGIFTVSQYSKKDILRFFPQVAPEKIYVVPLAADVIFRPIDKNQCRKIVKDELNISRPFLLYIGGFSPRKNLRGLINAFMSAFESLKEKHQLVIVGALKDEGMELLKEVTEKNYQEHIRFIGYQQESMLPILYNAAKAFIYPSLYEGFGLPPLEAMSCGTPVITSSTTSIPEVIAQEGILINPHKEEEIAEAMVRLLNDQDLQQNLSIKGINRSKEFSWLKAAEETLKGYHSIIKS